MSYIWKSSLIVVASIALFASEASAQYYNPVPAQSYGHQPGGLGLDLGLRNGGFNPNLGFGVGQVGAGVGSGFGRNGIGQGLNFGVGPLGVSADSGLGRNGLGVRASSGIGNTGASLEGGLSQGGLGLGASSKLFGFGPGASIGIGERGPSLGASVAFGPIGTLLIGSHRNSYPGAQQTAAYMYPNQNASYYTAQNYGNSPYYRTAPVQYPAYAQARPAHRPQYVQYPQYVQPTAPAAYSVYVQAAPQRQNSAPVCPVNWTC